MIKTGLIFLGAIVGGAVAIAGMVLYFGWGAPNYGQVAHLDPTRSDYVNLLLTLMTIFQAAIGLAVTVGALVIVLVALRLFERLRTTPLALRNAQLDEEIGHKI